MEPVSLTLTSYGRRASTTAWQGPYDCPEYLGTICKLQAKFSDQSHIRWETNHSHTPTVWSGSFSEKWLGSYEGQEMIGVAGVAWARTRSGRRGSEVTEGLALSSFFICCSV